MRSEDINDRAPLAATAAPAISVVLTVYTRTQFLAEALRSALSQTFQDYEVIVVDDSGSAIAREIVSQHSSGSRVRYFANEQTAGVVKSIQRAVKEARGEFIAILNDDDIWEETLIEELSAPLMADSKCVAAFSDHSVIDETGRVDESLGDVWSAGAGRTKLTSGKLPDPACFVIEGSGLPIAICTLFRRDAVEWSLFGPEVTGAYDYWLSCLLAASGGAIYYIPRRLARYRVHPEMESYSRRHDKWENMVYMYSTIRERGWFPQLKASTRSRLAESMLGVARDKLHFRRYAEARKLLWRAFMISGQLLPLGGLLATFLPRKMRSSLATSHWSRMKRAGGQVEDRGLTRTLREEETTIGR